ncbi:MAG: hypothetical protein A2268_10775 [Candidatus Raymondbacteria bacterium RifOxyA12_full_50_37]|uniref:STAS domain-containing protein n=1 Tax=Candidatus Raymondbacteria bacterium RIFOXYD12_FULL_49_13 TaxID=1817890 RepID=A0A1F7F8X7_UNCRA|nr:MAG: hypothetical protein A2268_10775 [Candidatus Raymondbacteria bacterium RifOxyA12_full_50_37]OGJ85446.1 MAG: hypothetical protein A2248_12560 [Candidatus Raymondbacteria bacterium RIFOXYA2_FULL_49_16]OGJ94954.1 MAG: hypothetical protein A2453_08030 [Candidatus Raymondbacteria bacterium RIFOXYC2_FULL_50_21]OGK02819.1 MAG: hypothetical protein A2487_16165 [Candidatus Raymondbacteria bacterium RifOxyC12_full_50_8]OGK03071.1 MAG: hypothetical protein A2519_21520 [Candidatus Raymondbacteria b
MEINISEIKLSDVFSYDETHALLNAGKEFLARHPIGNLYLDFTNVTILNSLAIGAIVTLSNRFKEQDCNLVLKNVPESIVQMLNTINLRSFLNIESAKPDKPLDVSAAEVNISLIIDFELIKNVGIFSFSGSLLTPQDSNLYFSMAEQILKDGYKMLLDLSGMVFIDSIGISAMVKVNNIMKKHKGEIRICGAGDILKDVLETHSLTSIIRLYPTREDALDGWL